MNPDPQNLTYVELLELTRFWLRDKERNPELPLDSIPHRINTVEYYMVGFKDILDRE